MNREGEGGCYLYPESLIRLQALIRAYFRLPYRQLEDFTQAISKWETRLAAPDYTTTCLGVNGFEPRLEPRLDGRPVTIAVDASGIKVADRGEWMRMKWKRRRGFLKIHIAVDVRMKQILAMEVTDEGVGDGGMLKPLVEEAENHAAVERVLADGAYDSRLNFTFLAGKGIEPAIRVRKNSSGRARGC